MRKVKLPKQLLDQVIQKAPEYKRAISEGVPVLLKVAGNKLAPVGKVLKEHWPKFLAGGIGCAVVIDDVHQRLKRKQEKNKYEEQEKLVVDCIRKQDIEIKVLKKEADQAATLKALNEQLCDALRESKGGDSLDEEVNKKRDSFDGTTD